MQTERGLIKELKLNRKVDLFYHTFILVHSIIKKTKQKKNLLGYNCILI